MYCTKLKLLFIYFIIEQYGAYELNLEINFPIFLIETYTYMLVAEIVWNIHITLSQLLIVFQGPRFNIITVLY